MPTSQDTVAIKATGITKWFGEGEARTRALDDVQLEMCFGEMVYIVGPSGSGKTTLLSVLSGILRPDAGTVISEGNDIWSMSSDALASFRLHKIGFAFQDFHLFPRLTVAENVAIPLILRNVAWDSAIAEARKFVDLVGLKGRSDIAPVKLSGGEQQRVAIARAIIGSPDLLIMDEPTASLDGDTGKSIVGFVKEQLLNKNRCIVIVTHDSRIYEFASRILHMEDGRLTKEEQGKQNED
ncbi:ABC transporter ATP-binding protein [Terriglobus sp. ADX1]|uniref:ABC transporter ATP-binding protein n=1 Tax=Terriglobus sp. ADX1 TaxID=2794063 RepID=UPI002FE56985